MDSVTMSNDNIRLHQAIGKIPEVIQLIPKIIKAREHIHPKPNTPSGLGVALEKAARINPDSIAIYSGDRSITYEAFNCWANKIAHYFSSKGVKKGTVIAILIENRPEILACIAGLQK